MSAVDLGSDLASALLVVPSISPLESDHLVSHPFEWRRPHSIQIVDSRDHMLLGIVLRNVSWHQTHA